ncbi:hypothetical protein FGL86_11080 [Pistricoccus aurantiacus]|uniref:Uncharacterized protein n=1 Tax=Pistricoccus aurantiacus TaxID=1883414 RepID=A0A5B8SXL7_9GAMM|nr:hypothetical protein [Pistricoccus aurantiacus]QEA39568.1 hypothetical protein FGL86_11080 [Pistricoccus aurantiacus]
MKTHEQEELSDTPEGKSQTRGSQEKEERGFEEKDLSSSLLVKSLLFMVLFVPACLLVLWALMSTVWQEPQRPPSPFEQSQIQTPLPHLQASPVQDYQAFHERMTLHLNSYGWVDRDANRVHIPIALAKQRLLEQGLPEANQTPPPSRMPFDGVAIDGVAIDGVAIDGVALDPQAATQWLKQGPAAAPVAREDTSPRDTLPPPARKENIPVRSAQESLEETFSSKEGQ